MFEEAITQGLISGGVASFTIFMFIKYLLPRFDKLEQKIEDLRVVVESCPKKVRA